MVDVTPLERATDDLAAQFIAARSTLPGAGTPWVEALRDGAIGRFSETGLPTARMEDWRFTDLRRLARVPFGSAEARAVSDLGWIAPWYLDGPCHRLVFANGRFVPNCSSIGDLPAGARLEPLAAALAHEAGDLELALRDRAEGEAESLVHLNTAMMRDGLLLRLERGVSLAEPVHFIHVADAGGEPVAVHPRILVVAGDGSRASVVETYLGVAGQSYWTNTVTDVAVGRDAEISVHKLQQESAASYHTGVNRVTVGQGGRYAGFVMSLGARLARTEIRVALQGEHASCRIDGSALLRGRQHGDLTTEIDHRVPHGLSRQSFKNVVDDRSRGVFQGRVVVREDAQKTDAAQSNRNLLLSREAEADSKPELRIFADDVKCSHGATVGELDKNALFYLRSRGIGPEEARALLIEGFVAELIEDIAEPAVAEQFRRALGGWLGAARDDARNAA